MHNKDRTHVTLALFFFGKCTYGLRARRYTLSLVSHIKFLDQPIVVVTTEIEA